MSGADFYDTNVLVYLLTNSEKAEKAERLVAQGGVISVQVLNEFVNVARRKYSLDWPAIHEAIDAFKTNLIVKDLTLASHELGLAISERYRLSIYDGQLLACASLAGCTTFWSEDLSSGFRLGQLIVRNPFA